MFGSYKGLEFNEQGDIAHQFSNKVANVVGTYLKAKYREGLYLKIDLKNTKINTKDLADKTYVEKVITEGAAIENKAQEMEKEIIALVEEKIKL
jgi:formiminotetrahydrofolate cyclodeaminase